MKQFIRTPRALLLGVIALAVVLVGAGVASGTIGASKPNVYWACVPKDGRIKLVYPGSKCKKGERFIKWNQTGPQSATVVKEGLQGLKGDGGAQGEAGAAGAKGTDGAPGTQGAKGEKGDKGDKGDKGENGAAGPKGDAGAAGAKGTDGAPGPQGGKGDKGDTGDRGANGTNGVNGTDGPVGPQGPEGPKGDKGEAGPSAAGSAKPVIALSQLQGGEDTKSATATCPSGTVVIGGGYDIDVESGKGTDITVVTNRPAGTDSWTVTASDKNSSGDWSISAHAVCMA